MEKTNNILYHDENHKNSYVQMIQMCRRIDTYHKATLYLLSLSEDTRRNISQIFDFEDDCIIPEALTQGWQTSGTDKLCRLAFNLWNGYCEEDGELFSPYYLFDSEWQVYLFQAMMLRFPNCVS